MGPYGRVSVVIPTRGRCDSVAALVEVLQLQILDDDNQLEIIVVLDGDVDGTEQAVAALQVANRPVIVRLSDTGDNHESGHGAAAARNAGVDMATGTLVVFIDDDIEPVGSGFVASHVERHPAGPSQLVVGKIENRIDEPTFLFDLACSWWDHTQAQCGQSLGFVDVTTANLSLPVSLFHQLGGFDERLHRREDRELGVRAQGRGIPIVAEPRAVGVHHFSTATATYLRDVRLEGDADVAIARANPWVVADIPLAAYDRIGPVKLRVLRLVALNWFGDSRRALFVLALTSLERVRLRRVWRWVLRQATAIEYWSAVGATTNGFRDRSWLEPDM